MFLRVIAIFMLLALLCHLSLSVVSVCPESCKCYADTLGCKTCLYNFMRFYNSSAKNCPCQQGHQQSPAHTDYCIPKACKSFASYGCTTCFQNMTLQFNPKTLKDVCYCEDQNIQEQDQSTNMCTCKSESMPDLYYYNPNTQICSSCPLGCKCSIQGCFWCQVSTLRQVKRYQGQSFVCQCKYPYLQTNDYRCVCPQGCICTVGGSPAIQCDPATSHRIYSAVSKSYVCRYPWKESNASCVCKGDDVNLTTYLGVYDCYCAGIWNWNSTLNKYIFNNTCVQAQSTCQCDEKGCNRCDTPRITINGFNASCSRYYEYTKYGCSCKRNFVIVDTCVPISQYDKQNYYFDSELDDCFKCPPGCSCNTSGCHTCTIDTKREVEKNSKNENTCHCDPESYEDQLGYCRPKRIGKKLATTWQCNTDLGVYSDAIDGLCKVCPDTCVCNSSGCSSCTDTRITYVQTGTSSSCRCVQKMQLDANGETCVCQRYMVLNGNGECECTQNYYYNTTTKQCQCLSDQQPEQYYFDSVKEQCLLCPVGCVCSSKGCIECSPLALRFVYRYNNSNLEIETFNCQCLMYAIPRNGECTKCLENEYYVSGVCVPCPNCKTCNFFQGCTSCQDPNTQTLDNGKCVCKNSSLTIYQGICICSKNMYIDEDTQQCIACPYYCETCVANSRYRTADVNCLSCSSTDNRENAPQQDCPCLTSFYGSVNNKTCCPIGCETCDSQGVCLSCTSDINRQLRNGKCGCVAGYVEPENVTQGSFACICPIGKYFYVDTCVLCPPQCRTCQYNKVSKEVVCKSCLTFETSRQDDPSNGCPCKPGFLEGAPKLAYCYPYHCANYTYKCSQCDDSSRKPSADGLACECINTTFLSSYDWCELCIIQGCLSCWSGEVCLKCNESAGYYKSLGACYLVLNSSSYSLAQIGNYISVVFALSSNVSLQNKTVSASIVLLDGTQGQNSLDPTNNYFQVKSKDYFIHNDFFYLTLQNPDRKVKTSLLNVSLITSILVSTRLLQEDFIYQIASSTLIYVPSLYTPAEIAQPPLGLQVAAYILIGIAIVVSAFLHIRGFKSMNILFFLHTLGFISYSTESMQMSQFLYRFRFSWLGFSTQILLPLGYRQTTFKPNIVFLDLDSNFLRIAFIPFIIFTFTISLKLIVQLILNIYRRHFRNKAGFRTTEFIYRSLVYPLIYFAILEIANNNAKQIPKQMDSWIKYWSVGLAIGCLVMVIVFSLRTIIIGFNSKLVKMEFTNDLIFSLANSILLIFTKNKSYVAIIAFVILRSLIMMRIRLRFVRPLEKANYLRLFQTALQVFTILITLTSQATSALALIITVVLVKSVIGILILYQQQQQGANEKIALNIVQEEQKVVVHRSLDDAHKGEIESSVSSETNLKQLSIQRIAGTHNQITT